jgi:hypothetical protein
MSSFDYDYVSGDFEPYCDCNCWECRHERHYNCSRTTMCVIARTCGDCGTLDGCICDQVDIDPEEIGLPEIPEVAMVDCSPLNLSAIGAIVSRMREIDLGGADQKEVA